MVGKQIQQYKFVEKLGAGGMGEIYKAHDTRLNRTVAIKVLPSSKSGDPERRRRFLHEAQAASSLNHPSIITIHDAISDGDTEYMVMEFVNGKTLNDLIPRGGLRVQQALKFALQMTDALATAHAAGIIHRDLKPANIMVTESGFVKILDFGLAKLTDRTTSFPDNTETLGAPLTVEGAILGTVSYMSPEQAQGQKIDTRSDIFSCGAVLFEMLTGRRAFEGGSSLSTLSAILRDETASITELSPDVPPQLESVIQRCLRKSPDDRWQTMREVQGALATLKRESDSGSLYTQSTTHLRPANSSTAMPPSMPGQSGIAPPAGSSSVGPYSQQFPPPPMPSHTGYGQAQPQSSPLSTPPSGQSMGPRSQAPFSQAGFSPQSSPQQQFPQQSFSQAPSQHSMAPLPPGVAKGGGLKKIAWIGTGVLVVLLGISGYFAKRKPPAVAVIVTPTPEQTSVPVATPGPEVKPKVEIDNQDILEMVAAKVPTDVILNQIHAASQTDFDLSTDEVIKMSKAGVPSTVIEQMRNPQRPLPSGTPVPPVTSVVNAITSAMKAKQDKQAASNTEPPKPALPAPTATPQPVPIPTPSAPLVVTPQPAAKAPEVHTVAVSLPDSLPFRITLTAEVPADAPVGQLIRFVVSEDFRVNGQVIIPKGATVNGEVTETAKKKIFGGGKLNFKLTKAEGVGGQAINVRALAAKGNDGATQRQVERGRSEYIGYIDGDQRINVLQSGAAK